MLLGDLGTEIINERPGEGDDTRAFAPPFQGDQAAYFLSIARIQYVGGHALRGTHP
jgi:crotonobetainyl-CoA:carnitine CoA-transferase CaiB-like acyl-CoA transferase